MYMYILYAQKLAHKVESSLEISYKTEYKSVKVNAGDYALCTMHS